jgi:hypothetical protein
MPRPRRNQPNSIIASAARVTSRKSKQIPQNAGAEPWQTEVWNLLDSVGELDFYRLWKANLFSRVSLRVVEVVDGQDQEVTSGPAWDAHQALVGGDAGEAQLMAGFGSLLSIPGEAWLFGIVAPDLTDPETPDQWRVLSNEELTEQGGMWVVDRGDGQPERYRQGTADQEPEAIAIRVWNPHPRRAVLATSSVRAAIPILRAVRALDQRQGAEIDSRLAANGILVLPQEASFVSAGPNVDPGNPTDPSQNPILAGIIDAAMTAISDRDHPAAVVPSIVQMPGDYIQYVRHITFTGTLDDKIIEKQDSYLGRLAKSLDCPGEVLTGMVDVNHWGMWLLDENNVKAHLEPGCELVVNALTTRYLWAVLQGQAERLDPALRRFQYRYDTSALRQRPDKSQPAAYLHDKLVITDAALARETGGFGGDDLLDPTSDEYRRRLMEQVAAGTAPPNAVTWALQQLGVGVPDPVEATALPGAPAALPSPDAPAGDRTLPVTPGAPGIAAAALLVPAHLMVTRALERARNRVTNRSRSGALRPVPAEQMDACLAGAWEQLPLVAAAVGVDERRLRDALETYTRTLLAEGRDHNPDRFGPYLLSRVPLDA